MSTLNEIDALDDSEPECILCHGEANQSEFVCDDCAVDVKEAYGNAGYPAVHQYHLDVIDGFMALAECIAAGGFNTLGEMLAAGVTPVPLTKSEVSP